jgi:hypothetical protein
MSKRFVDTELWQKVWFQEIDMQEKLLVLYLFQNCDNAGVWNINYRLASFILGFEVNKEMIININKKNILFDFIDTDKLWVIDFIKFQYGTLSENCKPHKPIIEKLKKYNLYERVFQGYLMGINTLDEKEEEKDKEEDNNLSFLGSSFLSDKPKKDPFVSSLNTYFSTEYKKIFGLNQAIFLSAQNKMRLSELAADYPNIRELIPQALLKLKAIEFKDIDFTPSASWLLKGDNFERVMNGEFDKKEKEKTWRELLAEKAAAKGVIIDT